MLELTNPIPEACNDTGKIRTFFSENGKWIVPYYGDHAYSSHSILKVIYDLCQLSPSFVAAEEGIIKYSFGKSFSVGAIEQEGLYIPDFESTVSSEIVLDFFNTVQSLGLSFRKLLNQTKELYRSHLRTGNHYLYIKEVTVAGQVSYEFKVLYPRQTAYLLTKTEAKKRIVWAKVWDINFWKKNKPKVIRATELYGEWNWSIKNSSTGNTIRETVVHGFDKIDESDWYGRSNKILSILNSMYVEYANSDMMCKTASSEAIAKVVWLFEQQPHNRGGSSTGSTNFKNSMNTLRKLMTVEGGNESKVMAGMEYPKGSEKPEPIHLNINRDTNYLKETDSNASSKIFGTLGWFRELTGNIQATGGLGANQIINLFLIAQNSTVADNQCYWQDYWNFIFKEIGRKNNLPVLINNGLKFTDNISDFINKLSSYDKGNQVINRVERDPIDNDPERLSFETLKSKLDAYGVGVRAGVFTPQTIDEESLRKEAGLPDASEKVF